jgi:protein TonB
MRSVSSWAVLVLTSALLAGGVQAQSTAPKKDGPELSDADRAKRDASKVFSFIKFHAVRSPAAAPAGGGGAQASAASFAGRPQDKAADKPNDKPADKPVDGQVAAQAVAPSPAAADSASPALDPSALVATAPTAGGAAGAQGVAAVAAVAQPVPPPVVAKPAPEVEELVELALIHHVQPEVPARHLANVRNGSVVVQFTVQPDGKTDNVFARPGAQLRLAQAAIRAVEQWRFSPIGEPRDVMVEVAFNFD